MQPGRWCCPRASWAVHRSRGWCRWRVQLPHPPLPLDDERSCAGVQPSWATGLRGQKAEAGCCFFERIGVPNNLIKLIDYQSGYHWNLSYIVVGYVFFDHGRALIGLDGHCQCLQRATCCTSPSTAGTSWSSLRPSWIGPRLGCNEWPLGPWMLWRRGRKGRSVLRMATGGSWAKASSCVGSPQCARCRRRRGPICCDIWPDIAEQRPGHASPPWTWNPPILQLWRSSWPRCPQCVDYCRRRRLVLRFDLQGGTGGTEPLRDTDLGLAGRGQSMFDFIK